MLSTLVEVNERIYFSPSNPKLKSLNHDHDLNLISAKQMTSDLRSNGRKLSFDVLTTTDSFFDDDDVAHSLFLLRSVSDQTHISNHHRRKRKPRKKKNKKQHQLTNQNHNYQQQQILDNDSNLHRFDDFDTIHATSSVSDNDDFVMNRNCGETSCSVIYEQVFVPSEDKLVVRETELRQRNSDFFMYRIDESVKEVDDSSPRNGSCCSPKHTELMMKQTAEINGNHRMQLQKDKSLDWKQFISDKDPNHYFLLERSPVKYFMEEMQGGNSLRMTTTLANEKERERVYDTIFRMPWRCELLIDVGFFVCLDSFMSLLTIMPMRLFTTSWRLLKTRQCKMLSAAELSDFGCFLMLASGVILLQQTDISLIYHMIRGQGTIKLYVVYNVLEIFDKLCQNFGGDVLQTLFNTADGLANSSTEKMSYWLRRYIFDEILAVASSIVHSFILLAQAITLSTCIVAHNNALFALLVSNNFSEIKSNVFKRFSKDNIQSLVYYDSVERFHIASFLIFVLAQNILEAEGPWFENFLYNALVVYICELMIDIIKHSFIAKFNDIKPIVYSEFLEDLCKQAGCNAASLQFSICSSRYYFFTDDLQHRVFLINTCAETLNMQPESSKKTLTFVPLAPACVVIRVLSPVYAAHLPSGPILWRLLWIFILSVISFVMLTTLKVMIGMGLQKHATWYINRCQRRKLHSD